MSILGAAIGETRSGAVRCRGWWLAAVLLPWFGIVDAVENADLDLSFPVTLENVWYRGSGKRGIGGGASKGDLTLTDEAFEFISGKRRLVIPLETIEVLSFGKMRGDVDTDWIVLGLAGEKGLDLVGFRDGSKLGFGRQTEELFANVRAAMRALRVGQYNVPDGYVPFDKMDSQFSFALPAEWSVYHLRLVEVDDRTRFGTMLVSEEKIEREKPTDGPAERRNRREMLARAHQGGIPAFLIDRRESTKGMSCDGFSRSAVEDLLTWAAEALLLEDDVLAFDRDAPRTISVGRCNGVRFQASDSAASKLHVDLVAVADEKTVVLFVMRSPADEREQRLESFEGTVSTLRFSAARD